MWLLPINTLCRRANPGSSRVVRRRLESHYGRRRLSNFNRLAAFRPVARSDGQNCASRSANTRSGCFRRLYRYSNSFTYFDRCFFDT